MEKDKIYKNGVRTVDYPSHTKNVLRTIPHTTYKNYIKMNQRSKCQS